MVCDFAAYAMSLPGVWAYYKLEDNGFADSSGNGNTARPQNFSPGPMSGEYPGGWYEQGTLLNQHRKTSGVWLGQAWDTAIGSGYYAHPSYVGADWTIILGGYKPIDMSQGHLLCATLSQHNLTIAQETNGAVSVNFGTDRTGTHEFQTPAGFITQWGCHMLAVAYTHSTGIITVYCGDWTSRFQVAANTSAITQGGSNDYFAIGSSDASAAGTLASYKSADCFLDDVGILIGHALTLPEARRLHSQAGYTGPISYPKSVGHRNGPFNRGATNGTSIAATSATASANLNTNSGTNTPVINYYQFDTAVYVVSGSYRKNPANCRPVTNARYDSTVDPELNAVFADVPIPYLGTGNAAAFGPAAGSDGHTLIVCPDTDEAWDFGVFSTALGYQAIGTTTNTSPNLALDQTTNPAVFTSGAAVAGAGIPASTTVLTPWDGTKVVLSHNATASATVGLAVTPASGLGYQLVYGRKSTQNSLDPGFYTPDGTFRGPRATGIPGIYGNILISELQNAVFSSVPIPHAVSCTTTYANQVFAWPAQRTDGSTSAYTLSEGMWLRLKQDSATTALIAAMPYAAGRAIATACQQYGLIITDSTGYDNVFEAENYSQLAAVGGYNAYTADSSGGTGSGGIFQGGSSYGTAGGNLYGFPWANFEQIDPNLANPAYASQPLLSAPASLGGVLTADYANLTWGDQALASYYNVYSVTAGPTYTLIAESQFPQYTLWYPGVTQFAVTAVNGGGESAKSGTLALTTSLPVRRRRCLLVA